MGRSRLFGSPTLIGFEAIERMLEDAEKASADGYPPYNIERLSDTEFSISLAVAGFDSAELEVQVQGQRLLITGTQAGDKGRVFIHQGIAGRQFRRSFLLAVGFEIVRSWLDKGILHIEVACPRTDSEVRKIDIEVIDPSSLP